MHLSEAFWTVYIYHWLSISGCHTISIYIYIYIYVSDQSGQIKDRDILSVVDAGKVKGQTGTNQALHTI